MKWYLTKKKINTDDLDLVPAGELPEKLDSVDNLLASINYEKEQSKSCGVKKKKAADVDLLSLIHSRNHLRKRKHVK